MQDLRYQVEVHAQATYIEAQSNPSDGRFVFTYTVTIENNGTLPAQLLHRYWKITDGEGGVREVHGDGVVGEQPTIVPAMSSPIPLEQSSKPQSERWKVTLKWLPQMAKFSKRKSRYLRC